MKRVIRRFGAAFLSFVMLFNANMPTVIVAEEIPPESAPETAEEVKEEPVDTESADTPAQEEPNEPAAEDPQPEVPPVENITETPDQISTEPVTEEPTVEAPVTEEAPAEQPAEQPSEEKEPEPAEQPIEEQDQELTEQPAAEETEAEETDETQNESETPVTYQVIAVYQTSDGTTLADNEEPLNLTEEETDTVAFAVDFGELYSWDGNAYITVGEETDYVIRLAQDHYVTAEEETVLYADWFSSEEPIYVVYTYESAPSEMPQMFSTLNAAGPLRAGENGGVTDLAELLAGVPVIKHGETVAEKDENGRTIINDSETYTIAFRFAEDSSDSSKQFSMTSPLVYTFPTGFTPVEGTPLSGHTTIEVEDASCDLTWKIVHQQDGTYRIEYTWPSFDTIPSKIKNSTDISMDFNMSGTFDSTLTQINFGGGKTVDIVHKNNSEIQVNKTGSYLGDDGKVHYEVTVTSKYGSSTNVHLDDTIVGSALEFDTITTVTPETATISNFTEKEGKKGFSCDVGTIGKDESVVIKYTANVNYEALEGTGTFETTGNTIKATSNENPDGSEKSNTVNNISYSSASKTAGTASDVDENGFRTIEWTAVLNSEKKVGLNTITDRITDTGVPMYYDTDSPLKINGTVVPWSEVGVTTGTETSWTYNVPEGDGPIEYTVTYKTKVKVDTISSEKEVKNHIETDKGGKADGTGRVGPTEENTFGLGKSGTLSDDGQYADWTITVEVPAVGMDECVIVDTLPNAYIQNTLYKDSLDGNVDVTFSDNPKEDKYAVTNATITDHQGT